MVFTNHFCFRLPSTSLTDQTSAYLVGTKWTPVILPLEECGVSFEMKASTESPHIPAYQTYPILDTCIQQGNPLMIFTHTSHVPMTCVSSWAKKDKERFTTHHFITSDHETLVGAWTIQSNLEIFGFVPTLAFLVYCQLLGWIHQQLHLFLDTELYVRIKRMTVIGRDSHPN